MDEFIAYMQTKPSEWSDVKLIPTDDPRHPIMISATHDSLGPSQLYLLDPFKSFDISSLPLPCFISFPSSGDDIDSATADFLKEIRGPKRSEDSSDSSPYLIYHLVSSDQDLV
jgi:hypothetical protein